MISSAVVNKSLHHTWYHEFEYQYWYHDSSLMKSYLDFMSSCHGLILMHYILYDVIVLMSSYDVIGSALDVMLWNQQWNHVYETHFCARALARFCCGFRGVAVHYNEGSYPRIRPSSLSSLAAAPSSSAKSLPLPRLATERRPALGVGRTAAYKLYHSLSLSWRRFL